MNFGAFAGGLSSGFQQGVKMTKTFQDLAKERGLQEIRDKGMAEATSARDQAIKGLVEDTGAPKQGAQPAAAPAKVATQPLPPIEKAAPAAAEAGTTTEASAPATTITPEAPTSVPPAGDAKAAPEAKAAPAEAKTAPAEAKADAPAGLPGRYKVGDKFFATEKEAFAHAEKNAPSLEDLQFKVMVPKMQQYYMQQGDIEKAEAWRSYAEKRGTQKNMETWAKAYRSAMTGNFEKSADHVFDLYKQYDDGITPLSKEMVKDKDGNTVGFNVKLRNDATGKEYTQLITPKELSTLGLSALSPSAMFEKHYQQQQAAMKIQAETARDNRKFGQQLTLENVKQGNRVSLEGVKQGNAVERLTIQEQLKAAGVVGAEKKKIDAKVGALKSAGYSDDFINDAMPGIIGIGDYKKATSPEEARRLAHSDRMKSDPMYARKSPADQEKILDGDMKLIFNGVKPSTLPPKNAASDGLPPKQGGSNPPAKKQGIPVYDTKTGEVTYR